MAADFLAIAISELSDISERRIDRLINPIFNKEYPFLVKDGGLNSGFMVAQYVAAALVSQNQTLCHPAVIDSIPTSSSQEDHVSMGMTACLKLWEVLDGVEKVLAIEMICAAQSLDLQNKKTGDVLTKVRKIIRKYIPFLNKDRILADDIQRAVKIIERGEIICEI